DGPLRPRLQTRLGRRGLDHRLASPTAAARTAAPQRPPARTTRITDSPRTAGPQPRNVLRLALPGLQTRLGRRGPSPATSSGSHYQDYRLASDGEAPAPRRPPARTTRITDSPRTARPQPRDVLRLALPGLQTRLGRRGPSPATSSGSH